MRSQPLSTLLFSGNLWQDSLVTYCLSAALIDAADFPATGASMAAALSRFTPTRFIAETALVYGSFEKTSFVASKSHPA